MSIEYNEISKKVSLIGLDILRVLEAVDFKNISELRSKIKTDPHKLTAEIARLEGACLIDQANNDRDKRSTYYKITVHGLEMLKIMSRK